jgi:hypothetical protein
MFPVKGLSRTRDDYTQLFQLHADLGDERRARECLSLGIPLMTEESPMIALEGLVVPAIMHCILVADPTIHKREEDGPPSFYMPLWTDCQEALAFGA